MSEREPYAPGAAFGTEIRKEGDQWTLVVRRDLPHPAEKVWLALTQPEHLRKWAPFDSDRSLGTVGVAKLSTIGTPQKDETRVKRADAPRVLEYSWGGAALRWELEPMDSGGTRLTLWHNIDRNYIAMGAAGWHICLDVLAALIADKPIGRRVGPQMMQDADWQRLFAEYSTQFEA